MIKTISQKTNNQIIIDGDIAKVVLYKNRKPVNYAIIDKDDVNLVAGRRWHIHDGYAKSGVNNIQMHKAITGGMADHINRNRLDNRRSNLRTVEHYQNMFNMPKPSHNTSGYIGVQLYKRINKYKAYISVDDKYIHLGYFDDPIDGAYVRDQFAMQIRGKFAVTNFEY